MNKVLIIGCSHLNGAYDKNDNVVGPESWGWQLYQIRKTQDQYIAIACPGQGIMHYGMIIQELDKEGLLNDFTHCIIQLTDEPRLNFHKPNSINNYMEKVIELVKNVQPNKPGYTCDQTLGTLYWSTAAIHTKQRAQFEHFEERFPGVKEKTIWLDITEEIADCLSNESTFVKSIFPIYYRSIMQILNKNDITPIVFDFWGKSADVYQYMNDRVCGSEFVLDSLKHEAINRDVWNISNRSIGGHHDKNNTLEFAKIINEFVSERLSVEPEKQKTIVKKSFFRNILGQH